MSQTEKILDYEAIQQEYSGMGDMIIENFEKTCFDLKMDNLLQGMLQNDWVLAMVSSHTLKGSAGYIKAHPFINTVKIFQQFVKDHCQRIEYPDNVPATVDRPQYQLKEEFDDDKKLQAYEYFHPIVPEANLLKKEMSKYSKSEFPKDIYLKEGEKIKEIHFQFKQQVELRRKPINKRISEISINTGPQQQQTEQKIQTQQPKQMEKQASVLQNVDPPQQNSNCCDKCTIF